MRSLVPVRVTSIALGVLLLLGLVASSVIPANAADKVDLRRLDRPSWEGGPLLAANARGATVAVWVAAKIGSAKQPRVRYRWVSPDGAVGPIRTLRGTRGISIGFLDVAVGSGRDLALTWSRFNLALDKWDVWAIRVVHGHGATPKRLVSERGVGGWIPTVAMTASGHAAVSYHAFGRGYSGHQIVALLGTDGRVRRRVAAAGMGEDATALVASPLNEFVIAGIARREISRVTRVAPNGETRSRRIPSGQLSTGAPYDVAVDDRGSISVLFQGWLGDDRPSLWLRTWRAKGGLDPAREVWKRRQATYWATHASAGSLRHVVWGGAGPDDNALTVYTRTVGSDGRLGRVHRVGKVEKRPAPAYYDVAMVAASGSGAVVVWPWQLPGGATVTWMRRLDRDGSIGVRREVVRGMRAYDVVVQPKGRVLVALADRQDGEPWLAKVV